MAFSNLNDKETYLNLYLLISKSYFGQEWWFIYSPKTSYSRIKKRKIRKKSYFIDEWNNRKERRKGHWKIAQNLMFFVFLNIAVRYGGISSFTLFDFSSYLLTVYSPGIKAPQANKISKLGSISSVRSQVILIHKDGCTRLNSDEIELIELKNELINWRLGIDNYSIFRNPIILFID